MDFLDEIVAEIQQEDQTTEVVVSLIEGGETPFQTIMRLINNNNIFKNDPFEIDEAFLDNILSARNSNFFTQELFEQISNIDWASAINKMDNMDRVISYTFVKNFASELKKHPSVIRSNTYF